MAKDAGLDLTIDSAGTGGWHEGDPPDPRMRRAAAGRGYDLETIRARPFDDGDGFAFDRIYVMDGSNLRDVEDRRLPGWTARIEPFCSRDVPDPYHGGEAGFARVLDMLEDRCRLLIEELRNDR
jgi:protein-tyrosine phosphatase